VKAIILTEGGQKAGFGHISRCVALAQAFRHIHISVKLSIEGDDSVSILIPKEVPNDICDWQQNHDIVKDKEIVVIDSYYAPIEFYDMVYENAEVAVFFDDFARLKYPGGIIINNQIAKANNGKTVYLTGNQFLPLRKAFWNCSEHLINKEIMQVLISLGGGKPDLDLLKLLIEDVLIAFPECQIHCITGKIFELPAENSLEKITIHAGLDEYEMVRLFAAIDLAISSGGVMLNELATCNVPTIAFLLAENQLNNIENLSNQGLIGYAGNIFNADFSASLQKEMLKFRNLTFREKISKNCLEKMDGKGVVRIAKTIRSYYYLKNLKLRIADETDLLTTFTLSNDPEVRNVSFNNKEIDFKEHEKWFYEKIGNSSTLFLIAEVKDVFVGQIRFEVQEEGAVVGFSMEKHFRGEGLSYLIMQKAIDNLKVAHPTVKEVFAYIKKVNERSIRYFEQCGYVFSKEVTSKDFPSLEYVLKL
jgi:UDP-2,4-diacetamido-2,4,6-trideoxy-beta-L-altropyranose hydrolase